MTSHNRFAKIMVSTALFLATAGGLAACTVKHDDRIPASGDPIASTTALSTEAPVAVLTNDPKP